MVVVTKELALRYFWPHLDYGNRQVCARFACGGSLSDIAKSLKHGDAVDTSCGKAIFRLLDAGLYEDWFTRDAMLILKQHWSDIGGQ